MRGSLTRPVLEPQRYPAGGIEEVGAGDPDTEGLGVDEPTVLGDAVGLGAVGFFEGCFFGFLSLALPALLARAVTPVVAPASAGEWV